MKPRHQPSNLHEASSLTLPTHWTPQQALAVVELIDDLRELIYRNYLPQIQKAMRQDRSTKLDPTSHVDQFEDEAPF